jgi:hypothetical protein
MAAHQSGKRQISELADGSSKKELCVRQRRCISRRGSRLVKWCLEAEKGEIRADLDR